MTFRKCLKNYFSHFLMAFAKEENTNSKNTAKLFLYEKYEIPALWLSPPPHWAVRVKALFFCRSSEVLLSPRVQGREMETATPHAGEIKNWRHNPEIKNRSSTAGVPVPQKVSFLAASHGSSLEETASLFKEAQKSTKVVMQSPHQMIYATALGFSLLQRQCLQESNSKSETEVKIMSP